MTTELLAKPLDSLLEKSAATEEFKDAVRQLAATGKASADRIAFNAVSPPVKVLRVISKMLAELPALPVERVSVEGFSGCSDYVGKIEVKAAKGSPKRFDFTWDCKWRAEQEGWKDAFGLPDQMRAARLHGWDCFEKWEKSA